MELRKVTTKDDVEMVRSFFYEIFKEETQYDLGHFEKAISGKHDLKRLEYYLGYEGNEVVGVSGVYADKNEECWLGWFGVRPECRRKGYGAAMLDLQLEMMKNYGYKVCRLYTDKVINKIAVKLYTKKGFQKDFAYKGNNITMAKSLDNVTVAVKWKGKPLGFV
ncbi:MAG: GNAT family N-acetyltransferase [Alphaproteobacteria bacterium]|nr:GNAT family N-acetyltransferase [Alphaproteobacteria bacterium]